MQKDYPSPFLSQYSTKEKQALSIYSLTILFLYVELIIFYATTTTTDIFAIVDEN